MEELKLHDIKGLVEIPDNSIYYFFGLMGLLTLSFIIAAIFFYKYLRRDKVLNLQKHYKEQLQSLNLSSAKESAYLLSHYGELLEKSPEQEELFKNLSERLESYKYKKNVPDFDEKTQSEIQNFLDAMNV